MRGPRQEGEKLQMTNHPNRGQDPYRAGRTPGPAEVIAARAAAGLTQIACAQLIHCGLRSWQDWEAGERQMHPAFWELFCTKAGLAQLAPETAVPAGPRSERTQAFSELLGTTLPSAAHVDVDDDWGIDAWAALRTLARGETIPEPGGDQ
jgi:putative transcriptional regulator